MPPDDPHDQPTTHGPGGRLLTPPVRPAGVPGSATAPVGVGAVSFVNTLPLIDGLEACRDLRLRTTVPSLLLDTLAAGEVDVALCSSIDYQRAPAPMAVVPCGRLGCDGPTLTVRLYAQRPPETLEVIHCDTDSHTSVALLRIILRERYGVEPAFLDYHAREGVADARPVEWPDAMLLIGDKVVTDSPPAVRYPHQIDLGEAWHALTGLPFTFAVWMTRADAPPERIAMVAAVLDRQRRRNRLALDGLIHDRVVPRGWPADLARDYLGRRIRYGFDARAAAGLERFWVEAANHGLIPEAQPLRFVGGRPAPDEATVADPDAQPGGAAAMVASDAGTAI